MIKNTNNIISQRYKSILDFISQILGIISGFAILSMVILVTFNVITRKFFNWSLVGFYEIIGLISAVLYSFGIVYCAIKGQHIMMDLITSRLPKKAKKVSEVIISIIVVIFCILFSYAGIDTALGLINEKTYDLQIPVAPFRFGVVFAFIMLGLLILGGKDIGKRGED